MILVYGQIHLPLNGTLTDNTSIKWAINETIFFHPVFMKLGEVRKYTYYNFTKFHQYRMKNKKVLLRAHLMDVLSVKVLLRGIINFNFHI